MDEQFSVEVETLIAAWNKAWAIHEDAEKELVEFRTALVRFLHEQGLSMEAIGARMLLTRQRVSQILQTKPGARKQR